MTMCSPPGSDQGICSNGRLEPTGEAFGECPGAQHRGGQGLADSPLHLPHPGTGHGRREGVGR